MNYGAVVAHSFWNVCGLEGTTGFDDLTWASHKAFGCLLIQQSFIYHTHL